MLASENQSSDSGSGDDFTKICGTLTVDTNSKSLYASEEPPLSSPIGRQPIRSPRSSSVKKKCYSNNAPKSARVVHTAKRTLYTAGRPPWYDSDGQLKEAFVIGICGGSASGKTSVCNKVIGALDVPWVSLLSMDSFYKVLNEEQHHSALRNEYNFDHPDAFDIPLLVATLRRLKDGKHIDVPVYNFSTHAREPQMKTIYGANVIIFEGIMAFASKEVLQLLDLKVFVDTDSDIRLVRRLRRDISERGRDLEGVLKQYNKFVKPSFEHYIEPTMSQADIVMPRGGENLVAINLIVLHVHTQLLMRGFNLRKKLALSDRKDLPSPKSLYVLPMTTQVHGMHTIIRNQNTSRDEFIFYSKRLMRLLFEFAMSMLPFQPFFSEMSQGYRYAGKKLADIKLAGVSILRAGETMEQALREVCKDVGIGKILIQTNLETGEPELHYLRLPKDIRDCHIFLMDATVATGAAAMMAIRVLLDHDVPESSIILCSLLMAATGVQSVAYAFPSVKIVTTAIDEEMNDRFHIIPGIGNFGDRFFGTDYNEK